MLFSLYLALSIFGVGITLIDMILLAGHDSSTNDSDTDHSLDPQDMITGHSESNLPIEDHSDSVQQEVSHESESLAGVEKKYRFNPLLRILQFSRFFVYFSLGFGPVGLFAYLTQMHPITSLFYSIPTGLLAVAGAFGLRKLLSRELNSQLDESSLLYNEGTIIVPVFAGQIGKVRILAGTSYVDRYAKAKNETNEYQVGQKIRIVEVNEDCLVIDDESET